MEKYYIYGKKEIINILFFSLAFGLLFSFDQWISIKSGFVNLLLSGFLSFVGLFFFTFAQKYFAYRSGYSHEAIFSYPWILFSVALVLISNGLFIIPLGYGAQYELLARQRLGKFRYGLNFWSMAMISMTGVAALFLLALLFKALTLYNPAYLFTQGIRVNLLIAIFSMLPLSPMIGTYLFFASRKAYVFLLSLIVFSAILLNTFSIAAAIAIALILSLIILGLFAYLD